MSKQTIQLFPNQHRRHVPTVNREAGADTGGFQTISGASSQQRDAPHRRQEDRMICRIVFYATTGRLALISKFLQI